MRRSIRVAFSLLRIIGMLAICIAWTGGPAHAAALAIVSASGGGVQLVDNPIVVSDSGPGSPALPNNGSLSVQAGDAGAVGGWAAKAFVNFSNVDQEVTLGAGALANRVDSLFSTTPGGGGAVLPSARGFARWIDQLSFENPDVLDLRAFTAFFVYFFPTVKGVSSGQTLTNFETVVEGQVQQVRFVVPGEYTTNFQFRIPALDLLTGFADLRMTLDANAFTQSAEESFAAYDHTAFLPPLVLADADGNVVPGTENLRIVGASGLFYPTVAGFQQQPPVQGGGAVPEPGVPALLGVGLGLLLGFRKVFFVGCFRRST